MIAMGPLGDRAWLARFASEDQARGWAAAVRDRGLPGIVDVVAAYASVAVYLDPDRLDPSSARDMLAGFEAESLGQTFGRLHTIPTLYDGPDLEAVAERLRLGPSEVIAAHSDAVYEVLAVGFLPGFPYAGDLPAALRGLPRRDAPRARVEAGSVAIAGRQTCVYPRASPGGWHLIGRTPLMVADLRAGFLPIRAGDRLVFVPIDAREYRDRLGERLEAVPRDECEEPPC